MSPYTSESRRRSVPSPADTPADVLAELAAALSRLGPAAGWYLFGAQAAIIWGRPRLTADIDITVRMEPEDPERLVRVLEDGGFRLRVANAADFVRRTRVLPFVHARTTFPVDVVLAGPGLEELFLSRAITVTLAGAAVPVMSPEDLIVTKVLAGRPKDSRGHSRRAARTTGCARPRVHPIDARVARGGARPVRPPARLPARTGGRATRCRAVLMPPRPCHWGMTPRASLRRPASAAPGAPQPAPPRSLQLLQSPDMATVAGLAFRSHNLQCRG